MKDKQLRRFAADAMQQLGVIQGKMNMGAVLLEHNEKNGMGQAPTAAFMKDILDRLEELQVSMLNSWGVYDLSEEEPEEEEMME